VIHDWEFAFQGLSGEDVKRYVGEGQFGLWQETGMYLNLALAVYQEVLARFPDYAYSYYEMAYAYQLNKQPVQAITAIEQALALMTPPNAGYYVRAGSIYEWVGDKNRALNAYRQALLIDPRNAAALEGVERLNK